MRHALAATMAAALLLAACGGTRQERMGTPGAAARLFDQVPPPLPDSLGFGTHVLALARSPRSELWVGTYGRGIFVLRRGARAWERIVSGDSTGISWNFINSFAFGRDSLEVWYGTVGNGYGVTRDGGRTWRNWQFRQLGPEWQYVVPDGIRVHEGVVYVATADGLRWSEDGGERWHCIGGADGVEAGSPLRAGSCADRIASLPTEYLLALDVAPDGTIWVGHARGVSFSRDRGRTWRDGTGPGLPARVRDVLATDSSIWVLTETRLLHDSAATGRFRAADPVIPGRRGLPGAPRALVAAGRSMTPDLMRPDGRMPGQGQRRGGERMGGDPRRGETRYDRPLPMIVTANGAVVAEPGEAPRVAFLAASERYRASSDLWAGIFWGGQPLAGGAAGLQRVLAGEAPGIGAAPEAVSMPEEPRHTWFRRPVADSGGVNPYIDGTYRYGSTMGGNFQQHQGVEFNNAAGTPVRAVADGVVVFAGPGEQGANTVAIRHDRRWEDRHIFTTYYHNSALAVRSGQRVTVGDVVAYVGNTGRATNDHLHLEVHVAPGPDSAAIVNPAERFPPYTVNPQLWIEPAPGTGIVAGRVFDAAGQPVPGARIYGLVVAYPEETPFSFAETYRERGRSDPAYGEHFAVGDVVPGDYLLGADIGGVRVWRRVRVDAGKLTIVEFRR